MLKLLVTTEDNPFDPFTQYEDWRKFDVDHGYYTDEYVARIAITSNELSDMDKTIAINAAVVDIVRRNIAGNYMVAILDEDTA